MPVFTVSVLSAVAVWGLWQGELEWMSVLLGFGLGWALCEWLYRNLIDLERARRELFKEWEEEGKP